MAEPTIEGSLPKEDPQKFPDIPKTALSIVLEKIRTRPDLVSVVEYSIEDNTVEFVEHKETDQENGITPKDIAYQTYFPSIAGYDAVTIDVFPENSVMMETVEMKGGLAFTKDNPDGTEHILNYGFMLDDTVIVMESVQKVGSNDQQELVEMIREDDFVKEDEAQKIRDVLEEVRSTLW